MSCTFSAEYERCAMPNHNHWNDNGDLIVEEKTLFRAHPRDTRARRDAMKITGIPVKANCHLQFSEWMESALWHWWASTHRDYGHDDGKLG